MTPPPTQTESDFARDPVEELAEAFFERYRHGERPSLSEFAALAPEHAQEILELFPALVLMERAQLGTPGSDVKSLDSEPFERLGDYRIIREVGRGGMGIVFEAEQETLGRRVALKVLPGQSSRASPGTLLRFRREARSAARLHHTNIVPVFDVGERDGVQYYALQFIQGQGLDEVIAELRRLRELSASHSTRGKSRADSTEESTVVHSNPSSDFVDPLSSSTKADGHFYRSVAHIGLQAAEAIAYAHGQRVLHRDIKPSNLLLDALGTVWVTDFGLAKEEGDDLTRSGNIVGTLRYMAPERFNGVSDWHSDVYGLGLTLYELLTLRPAFLETDRAQLVRAIMHVEPAATRTIDPNIPRDLETIVLKAIAKEPRNRYATAEDLAADLRRFLADMPLLARRATTWERVGRWCRRNPGWAITLAAVCSLLVVIALGGAILSLQLRQALRNAQASSEQETERLWQAHLERARALRSSNRVGQRFQALTAIRDAAKIKVTRELRDEAVAALALPDVEIAQEWNGYPDSTMLMSHDAALRTCVRLSGKGDLTVCRIASHGEEVIAETRTDRPTVHHSLWMSPNGRFVVVARPGRVNLGNGSVKIWKLVGNALTLRRDFVEELSFLSFAFDPDSRRLAIGRRPRTVNIVDLESDDPPRTLVVGGLPMSMAFHPQGNRLAAACGESIRVLGVESSQLVAELKSATIDSWKYGLAWHPNSRVLAATCDGDLAIHFWDVERATEIMTPMEGHTSVVTALTFNHQGDRLISTGWDEQTRLWDVVSGHLLLTMPRRFGTAFGPDDATIGIERDGEKLRIWRVADGRELRRFRRPLADRMELVHSPVLHAEAQVLAAASNKGIVFFDLERGNELAFLPFNNATVEYPRRYAPTAGWLMCGLKGAYLWPAERDRNRPELLRIGPPRRLASAVEAGLDATPDGRFRVVPRGNHAVVLDRDRQEARTLLYPHYDVRHCAISPDGARVATFSWHTDGRFAAVRVWNAQTGKHVVDLPVQGSASGSFSPNGRWLATFSLGPDYQLWDVATWRPLRQLSGGLRCWVDHADLVATNGGLGQICVSEPESGTEVLRLTGPDIQVYNPASFTPDGAHLVAVAADMRSMYVWNLPLIGKQVRDLGLEWNWTTTASDAPRPQPVSVQAVEIDAGEWLTQQPK